MKDTHVAASTRMTPLTDYHCAKIKNTLLNENNRNLQPIRVNVVTNAAIIDISTALETKVRLICY